MRGWVDDCVNRRKGHDKCERKKSVLPTRVIDVQSNPPKVVVSNGISESYVALSHCWGGLIETRLLDETFSAFTRNGIPEEKLPPTFRDAIFVVRQLNIRWIWIDALCIIQDDANDWDKEAKLMGNVYEGAVFVLSAYSTPGSKAGLGFRRAACVATLQGGEEVYVQRGFIDQYDTFDPLGSRGWCLQEHVLAFAVLGIGRGHIEWTCPAGCYSEKNPKTLQTNQTNIVLNLVTLDPSINSQERAWRHVVTNYTERNLTFEGDKMAALAGVATTFGAGMSRFADSSRMTYVAGLWKETFLKDLMWASNPYNTITPRRERAPSWSWVSLDGPVTWTLLDGLEWAQNSSPDGLEWAPNFYRFCDIDFPSLKLSNTNNTAKSSSGEVSLSGLLVFLTKLPVRRPDVQSVDLNLRDKVIKDDSFFDESLKTALLGAPGSSARVRRDMHGSIDRDTEAPCWALRLAGAQTSASQYSTVFMMLEEAQKQEVDATSKQVFRRVGMLLVSTDCVPVTPIPRLLDDPYGGMWSGEVAKVTVI
ncbi:heterokaryon incompatibility protein-domain-containing protein [Phyllosticta capitalensis]|uniref:Heterokaryon incompatibility protein-domain-containing protein n=1 Tax=Phyllosticta capitalensis TaxID=121624 RepID=A0ABR1Z3W1_9PEZI